MVTSMVDPLDSGWDVLASESTSSRALAATDVQATDTLASEALNATDGAFPSVADAIEAANFGSGIEGTIQAPSITTVADASEPVGKPGFQTASKAPLIVHIQAPATTKPSTDATPSRTVEPSNIAKAKPTLTSMATREVITATDDKATDAPASHVASTVGSSLAPVANASGFDTPADTPSSTRDAKAGPTVDDFSTAKASGGGVKIVTDAQATDALAAEALDATDGAFPTVDDPIEVGLDSMTPSGTESYVSTAKSTGSKPGLQTASKAPLSMHIQAPATRYTVSPSGIDSNTSSAVDSSVKSARAATSVGGSDAQVVMETRLEAPGTTKPSTVTPSGIDSIASSTVDSTVNRAGVSTPRRELHPFLTTENAKAYAQDPRMEGLSIDIDDEYPSEIQHLPWNVFLTPRERGARLQDEYVAAHYAVKQLRNGELIRRVCDDWNYNSAN